MNYRTLGSSGLQVSPICLGTMTFGSPVGEADAIKLVHEAIDLGINFIDTANAYEGYDRVLGSAGGVAESIIGKALKGRREQVVLATKACAPVGPSQLDRGLSAAHILREVDRSLLRMNVDYIDLYIIHWPDKHTPLQTTLAALDQVVRQGKVRCIGASNHSAAQLCEFLWLADKHGLPAMVSSQVPLSLLLRAYEHDFSFCEQHGIGVTPYQSLQGGLLTGKYKRGQADPGDSRAAEKPGWVWPRDDVMYDKLEGMQELAAEIGVLPAQYALAWALSRPAISSLVVGAKRIDQVKDAIRAADVVMPDAHFSKLDELFPPPWKQMDPIRG
jgi:aryl-alcohol dehydrogenase-like predicted oxidoreductase